jgi:hypothetical protein
MQKIMELNVEDIIRLADVGFTPQAAEPGFKPHYLSLNELSQLLKDSKNTVFLTGSGICKGIGLPTYRGYPINKSS